MSWQLNNFLPVKQTKQQTELPPNSIVTSSVPVQLSCLIERKNI